MPQSYVVFYVHLVFTTKNREPLLSGSVRHRLHQYIAGIARNLSCRPIAIGGVEDHIHILAQLNRKMLISELVRGIKSNSSRWIHETFSSHREFEWQDGYAAFSVSRSHVNAVAQYIHRQEEHHRRKTFEDELKQFAQ